MPYTSIKWITSRASEATATTLQREFSTDRVPVTDGINHVLLEKIWNQSHSHFWAGSKTSLIIPSRFRGYELSIIKSVSILPSWVISNYERISRWCIILCFMFLMYSLQMAGYLAVCCCISVLAWLHPSPMPIPQQLHPLIFHTLLLLLLLNPTSTCHSWSRRWFLSVMVIYDIPHIMLIL